MFQIGDKVKIINAESFTYHIGKNATITAINEESSWVLIEDGKNAKFKNSNLQLIGDDNSPNLKYKVGDMVKIVSVPMDNNSVMKDKIGKTYRIDSLNPKSKSGYYYQIQGWVWQEDNLEPLNLEIEVGDTITSLNNMSKMYNKKIVVTSISDYYYCSKDGPNTYKVSKTNAKLVSKGNGQKSKQETKEDLKIGDYVKFIDKQVQVNIGIGRSYHMFQISAILSTGYHLKGVVNSNTWNCNKDQVKKIESPLPTFKDIIHQFKETIITEKGNIYTKIFSCPKYYTWPVAVYVCTEQKDNKQKIRIEFMAEAEKSLALFQDNVTRYWGDPTDNHVTIVVDKSYTQAAITDAIKSIIIMNGGKLT